jgi:DNA-directed RNA polymerase subunit RPC12/RpoP
MIRHTKRLDVYRCNKCWQVYDQDPAYRTFYECPKCRILLTRIGSREIEVD